MNKKVSLRNPMAILASVTVAISSVFISVSTPISANAAATWTKQTSAGTLTWNSIASSSDGTKLAATALWDGSYNPRGIFTSTDSGATWTEQTSAGNALWHGIASSADGTKLVAVQQYDGSFRAGGIFTSSDSGATWTERTSAGKASWQSVASSADGTHLIAASVQTYNTPGNIFTSADSGVTWTLQTGAPNSAWSSVTSSDDGTKLAATQDGGRIFTSSDSGSNWTEQMGAGQLRWSSIASSADGSKLLASESGIGQIWRSTDGGATWTDLSVHVAGFWYWRAVASSDDGNTLAIAAELDENYYEGAIFTSADAGQTWSRETGAGIATWSALSMNSDGSKIAATSSASGASSGSIWTNYGSSAPATAPALSASTPSIPNTYTGSTSATQTETITNTGDGDLVFGAGAVTVAGANSNDFNIIADNCSNQTIAPAGTCTVTYTFSPGGVGSRTANLVFTSNNASSPDSVVLTATGVGLPVFSASTPSIAKTYVGAFSPVQTETITNAGNADLVFGAGAVTKTGANATDFTIVADNCSNHTVAPAATCTVTYKFKSTVAGTRTVNLVFASNAASSPNSVVLSVVAMGVVTIKKIDSTSGSYKGGVKVEITGTGFTAGSTVTFGGLTAVITKRTGTTSFSVKTPAHAVGAVPVVVTNPDGGTATYNSYTYKK